MFVVHNLSLGMLLVLLPVKCGRGSTGCRCGSFFFQPHTVTSDVKWMEVNRSVYLGATTV